MTHELAAIRGRVTRELLDELRNALSPLIDGVVFRS